MDAKVTKLIKNYWNISKIVAVIFTICNYEMWTEPFNFVKAMVLIFVGLSVTFLAINLLDVFVGLIKAVCRKIHRNAYDKRLLKGFCEQKENCDL